MATESYVLNVLEVIEETDDAHSVVFEVPDELAEQFSYRPGQFLTVAVPSDETHKASGSVPMTARATSPRTRSARSSLASSPRRRPARHAWRSSSPSGSTPRSRAAEAATGRS